MKAGVVIDPWKEEIFDRHYKAAGLSANKVHGDVIITYTIETDNLNLVATVTKAANEEAKRTRQ